jgi:SAM-dependent methyltransferase
VTDEGWSNVCGVDLRELRASTGRRHPWEQARAALVAELVPVAGGPVRVLDAGSGDAYLARDLLPRLPAGSTCCCWDIEYTQPEIDALSAVSGDAFEFVVGAPDDAADVALALDVIEHIEDDRAFVGELFERIRPGGVLVVTVPAWPWLYSEHDVALGHWRRYTPGALEAVVSSAGFSVMSSGGLFSALAAVRSAQRVVRGRVEPFSEVTRRSPVSDLVDWNRGPRVTRAITGALELEGRASISLARRGIRVPGLSCWAVCRRP